MPAVVTRAKRAFADRRERWPWLDHLARAGARYQADGGDRLAASLTYYGFLSLLPLLLLAISVLGFALHSNPELQQKFVAEIAARLPGVGANVAEALDAMAEHRRTTGLAGLLGLLYSGLGGIDALRESVRTLWRQDPAAGNLLRKKLWDAVTLGGLVVTFALSVGVSVLGAGLAGWLLDRAGVQGTFAEVSLSLLAIGFGLVTDTAIFVFVFTRLARCGAPWRGVLRGALFGAVGLGVLKYAAAFYVGRTTASSTALYGTIGAVVGVLVGLNLLCRFVLFVSAWTVTQPEVEQRMSCPPAPYPDEQPPAESRRRPAGRLAQSGPPGTAVTTRSRH